MTSTISVVAPTTAPSCQRGCTRAKAVFTESDEQCVFTVELDGVRKEPSPLRLDLEQLEDAVTDSGGLAPVKEALRGYFRRVLGQ